jgi:hypothetical protein
METIFALIVIVMMCGGYIALNWAADIVRMKGSPSYQRWRKRAGQLGLIDQIERAVAITLSVIAVIIVLALIIWKMNG